MVNGVCAVLFVNTLQQVGGGVLGRYLLLIDDVDTCLVESYRVGGGEDAVVFELYGFRMVTARASIAVFDRCERRPSGLSVPICKCGVSSSISNRNPMPNRNPTAAGNTLHLPLSASISIEGISSDHTDAATMTPDAKPNSDFCRRTDISPFMKNTKAEPSIVPSNGISSPMINVMLD